MGLFYAVAELREYGSAFPRAAPSSLALERTAELVVGQLKRPWLHPLQLARQAQDLSSVSYRIGASSAVETGLWYEWKKRQEGTNCNTRTCMRERAGRSEGCQIDNDLLLTSQCEANSQGVNKKMEEDNIRPFVII